MEEPLAADGEELELRGARAGEAGAILAVMRRLNMHHVPSPEMDELDPSCFFVALARGSIVGAGGWKVRAGGRGKTTLLAVLPEHGGRGIGAALQDARLEEMARLGVHTVTTNADRPPTIAWYKRRYGYREVGKLEKLVPFGDPDVSHWTTLELSLRAWVQARASESRSGRHG